MILFSGYQADGTLGRLILQGTNPVRVLGAPITVRAQIRQIQGFSGHAGRTELLDWLGRIPFPPKKVLIVHSGPNVGERFAVDIQARFGFNVEVAEYQKAVAIPR
jgi:metallo-beta-lactamase family protein